MYSKKTRCSWVNETNALSVTYHDKEWGRPVKNDSRHFEMLILEGAQAGLNWQTILNKRENYRKHFAGFDPKKVARFNEKKIAQLLKEEGIIRNRLKIASAIQNAKAFLDIQKEFGSFNKYIWGFVGGKPIKNQFHALSDIPAKTPLSDTISKDLKRRGFNFVGSTIIYAYLQAVGIVDDHLLNCFVRKRETEDWSLYILQCQDNSLYTGITKDINKRLKEHLFVPKRGAKYLRGKGEVKIVFSEVVGNKSLALKLEYQIKAFTKAQKNALIKLGSIKKWMENNET